MHLHHEMQHERELASLPHAHTSGQLEVGQEFDFSVT